MTYKYNNVYVEEVSTVVGPYESIGPLKDKFDKIYDNLYCGELTWEKAETKCLSDSIKILLDKTKKESSDIDIILSGDLLNQITSSCFGVEKYNIPFLGIFAACATITEGITIASSMIDSNKIKNAIVSTSSHNRPRNSTISRPLNHEWIVILGSELLYFAISVREMYSFSKSEV